jgi:hypothetical protein
MTPQEKAYDLIDKFRQNQFSGCLICTDDFDDKNKSSKQCALIAVDEIKQQLIENLSNDISAIYAIYWEKVKQEIEKL